MLEARLGRRQQKKESRSSPFEFRNSLAVREKDRTDFTDGCAAAILEEIFKLHFIPKLDDFATWVSTEGTKERNEKSKDGISRRLQRRGLRTDRYVQLSLAFQRSTP